MPSPIIKHFKYVHLPSQLRIFSRQFYEMATRLDRQLPDSPEKSAGLRKLLEAKDCFVRARNECKAFPKTLSPKAKALSSQPTSEVAAWMKLVEKCLFWGMSTDDEDPVDLDIPEEFELVMDFIAGMREEIVQLKADVTAARGEGRQEVHREWVKKTGLIKSERDLATREVQTWKAKYEEEVARNAMLLAMRADQPQAEAVASVEPAPTPASKVPLQQVYEDAQRIATGPKYTVESARVAQFLLDHWDRLSKS